MRARLLDEIIETVYSHNSHNDMLMDVVLLVLLLKYLNGSAFEIMFRDGLM
jgi:hypothetical protein